MFKNLLLIFYWAFTFILFFRDLLKVCNFLRSKSIDIRTTALDTLIKIQKSLGTRYFPFLLSELRGTWIPASHSVLYDTYDLGSNLWLTTTRWYRCLLEKLTRGLCRILFWLFGMSDWIFIQSFMYLFLDCLFFKEKKSGYLDTLGLSLQNFNLTS